MPPQDGNNQVINKENQDAALDFAFLRSKGIELIQQLAGRNWSDFNLHDPGVTMLEYLCFALTDIAYRTTFQIPDILADKKGYVDREKNFFIPKEEALSCCPVTINDYRKLLIDSIPEVDNVWLEPVTTPYAALYAKGLYNVIIKPDAEMVHETDDLEKWENEVSPVLVSKVNKLLMAYRNLGEHYETFQVLLPQPVYIKADIIIDKSATPEKLLATIYKTLEHTLNPPVTFYTEAELLAKGYAIEDIYNGPLLQHGIVLDSDLKNRMTLLDPFILTKAISALNGVVSIRSLQVSDDGNSYHSNVMQFGSRFFPYMVMDDAHPHITLYNDNYPLYIPRQAALKKEHKIRNATAGSTTPAKQHRPLSGEYRNINEYVSFQTLFPSIYNISDNLSNSSRPPAEIAKSRQLKAYLMLFEQLLANTLAQLSGISHLFSVDGPEASSTYHFQPLYQVPDAKWILKAFTDNSKDLSNTEWERFKADPDNGFAQALKSFMETDKQYKDRKKRAYDHVLARFNIAVHKHPILLYEFYYDQQNPYRRTDLELSWKAGILQNITAFTSHRVKADNYLSVDNDENLETGFGKKMALLLHIRNSTRRPLSDVTEKFSREGNMAETDRQEPEDEEHVTVYSRDEQLDIVTTQPEDLTSLTHHLSFQQQSALLFQSALDINNYRIIPYRIAENDATVILFKHPQETAWKITSRHADEYTAVRALKKNISFFREISIESEGFYVLEHLLLKPSVQAAQYGFNFVDQVNQVLIKQRGWQSFAEREETVSKLMEMAAVYVNGNYQAVVADLHELVVFSSNLPQLPHEKTIDYLMYNLKEFAIRNTDFYPAFEYTVMQEEGQEIAEDFFNFRLTVVLPSWPARFQDKSFREMAADLFSEECPAHLKVSLLWLSLSDMKQFDSLYFPWLRSLQDGTDAELSDSLIRFLTERGIRYNYTHHV